VISFFPKIDATISGIIQTAIIAIGGILFSFYIQYKKKQLTIETVMRKTLLSEEDFAKKIERFINILSMTDKGLEVSREFLPSEDQQKDHTSSDNKQD
jgi:hypothetical protein